MNKVQHGQKEHKKWVLQKYIKDNHQDDNYVGISTCWHGIHSHAPFLTN